MADTAFQTQYREEFISGFEQGVTLLKASVTSEAVVKGNTATFLVADSGDDTAVTRGANGLIPSSTDNLVQASATLAEWHNLRKKTGFNIFAGQGDQRKIMQQNTLKVMNRKIDQEIIDILDTGTVQVSASAATGDVALVMKALSKLGNADVPIDEEENMFGVITPALWAYLSQTKEFSSGEYVDVKTFTGANKAMWRWNGVNWIRSSRLTGKGTASAKCYIYHRAAVGHAVDTAGLAMPVGYDDEQDYSWARCTAYMGSVKLQNDGIVQILHDDSAYS